VGLHGPSEAVEVDLLTDFNRPVFIAVGRHRGSRGFWLGFGLFTARHRPLGLVGEFLDGAAVAAFGLGRRRGRLLWRGAFAEFDHVADGVDAIDVVDAIFPIVFPSAGRHGQLCT